MISPIHELHKLAEATFATSGNPGIIDIAKTLVHLKMAQFAKVEFDQLSVATREHKSLGPITSVDSGPHWLRISGRSGPDYLRTGPH